MLSTVSSFSSSGSPKGLGERGPETPGSPYHVWRPSGRCPCCRTDRPGIVDATPYREDIIAAEVHQPCSVGPLDKSSKLEATAKCSAKVAFVTFQCRAGGIALPFRNRKGPRTERARTVPPSLAVAAAIGATAPSVIEGRSSMTGPSSDVPTGACGCTRDAVPCRALPAGSVAPCETARLRDGPWPARAQPGPSVPSVGRR